MSTQPYDLYLTLRVPRSPPNLALGNFMLDLALLSPSYTHTPPTSDLPLDIKSLIPSTSILFSTRRPAILTYSPPLITASTQLASLPWYLLGWRRDEELLSVRMAENVVFEKGWKNVPRLAYLELQARGGDVQVYDVALQARARFTGLKWVMYNHRIFSFIVFTLAFWVAELIAAVLAWVLLGEVFGGKAGTGGIKGEQGVGYAGSDGDGGERIKKEENDGLDTDDLDLSDTPRSFPTYGRHAPLKYTPKIKKEEEGVAISEEMQTHPAAVEADDESKEPIDVEGDLFGTGPGRSDSGIGTSFSEGSGRAAAAKRRRSRGSRGSSG
jgi:seipin